MKQPDIEQLISERPFEMLNDAERAAVLADMPEWEYQRLHQLVLRSKATLKRSPKPDPAIRERLLEQMRKQPKPMAKPIPRKGLLVRLAQYRLPVWQAAAGVALLFMAHFALQKTPTAQSPAETVYVNTTDTIYKEVAIPVADTSHKIPPKRVNVKPRKAANPLPLPPTDELLADTSSRRQGQIGSFGDTLPGFQLTIQPPSGRSANEMKELWQFLGDVY